TLWMGRRVLKCKDRPSEMWGKYFRYLALVINSLWLVWVPIYSWTNLGELIPVAFGPSYYRLGRLVAIAAWFEPPMIVMWLCHLLSRQVYRNVSGAEWSPAEVIRRFVLGVTVGSVPVFFLILIISNWRASVRTNTIIFVVGVACSSLLA